MDTFHPFWTLFQKHSFQPFSTLKIILIFYNNNCLKTVNHIHFVDNPLVLYVNLYKLLLISQQLTHSVLEDVLVLVLIVHNPVEILLKSHV